MEAIPDPAIIDYKISESNVKGPFLEKLSAKMEDMKTLNALSYISPREAKKFHMSEGFLEALNPGKKFDRAGENIAVANVGKKENKLGIERIEIDKTRHTLKAFGTNGELIVFFPATVGSKEKPTPTGSLKVVSADANPNSRYNPPLPKEAFTIKPGPNNPVGSYWLGLSAEGFGIHGTPNPSKVSKSESHGCVRLTNWDVGLLGKNVKKGTPVEFVEEPKAKGKT